MKYKVKFKGIGNMNFYGHEIPNGNWLEVNIDESQLSEKELAHEQQCLRKLVGNMEFEVLLAKPEKKTKSSNKASSKDDLEGL